MPYEDVVTGSGMSIDQVTMALFPKIQESRSYVNGISMRLNRKVGTDGTGFSGKFSVESRADGLE